MNRLASKLPHQRIIPYKICNIAQIQRQGPGAAASCPVPACLHRKGSMGGGEGFCRSAVTLIYALTGASLDTLCWYASLAHLWQCGIFFSNRFVFVFSFTFSPELIDINM